MKRILSIVCLTAVTACDGPSPEFFGVEGTPISIDGSDFVVRVKGNRAEAVRTNFTRTSELSAVMGRAFEAIETVSGCSIRTKTTQDARVVLFEDITGVFEGNIEYGETRTGLDFEGDPALVKAGLDCS